MKAPAILGAAPPDAAADWTVDQGWTRYSAGEHQVWLTLYERQAALLVGRACAATASRTLPRSTKNWRP
jgi:phenylalanine-4-hydroxylase